MSKVLKQNKLVGFKGFDRDLKCRDMKYEVGKTYEHDGDDVKLCSHGLHFCEDPSDVLNYYPSSVSRFAEVEASGVSDETSNDSKRVAKKLRIIAELGIDGLIKAILKFRFSKVDWEKAEETSTGDSGAASATGYRGAASATGDRGAASATGDRGAASATGDRGAASATGDSGAASATGDSGAASATGYRGAASATGDRGAASATGYRGAASATGYQGVAVSLGIYGRAKAVLGGWITIAEWKEDKDNNWQRIDVQTAIVDDKEIKAETFYMLKGGRFVEANDN